MRSPRNATHVSTTRKCCNKKEIVFLFVLYVYANGPDPAAAPVANHEILRPFGKIHVSHSTTATVLVLRVGYHAPCPPNIGVAAATCARGPVSLISRLM